MVTPAPIILNFTDLVRRDSGLKTLYPSNLLSSGPLKGDIVPVQLPLWVGLEKCKLIGLLSSKLERAILHRLRFQREQILGK